MKKNPIPFNANEVSMAQARHCVEFTRTLFDMVTDGTNDEQIADYVAQKMNFWQRREGRVS